ncbi:hypothetical protein [Streptococcus agalactiae]|uniref:hypothetical protein n=1 Tax=Streptococcus agalactiae TaxID=1311 RepID=UPI00178C5C3C|nr:hypothetical protein [Streptococcus agalactiae]
MIGLATSTKQMIDFVIILASFLLYELMYCHVGRLHVLDPAHSDELLKRDPLPKSACTNADSSFQQSSQ